MGKSGLRHLWQEHRHPVTRPYPVCPKKVGQLVGKTLQIIEAVVSDGPVFQSVNDGAASGSVSPLVADVDPDVVMLRYLPSKSLSYLLIALTLG